MDINRAYRIVRILLAFFIFGLTVSGLTAFPLILEVNILEKIMGNGSFVETIWPDMAHWISFVHQGLNEVNNKYPFMLYGTDWLAFAHITIITAQHWIKQRVWLAWFCDETSRRRSSVSDNRAPVSGQPPHRERV